MVKVRQPFEDEETWVYSTLFVHDAKMRRMEAHVTRADRQAHLRIPTFVCQCVAVLLTCLAWRLGEGGLSPIAHRMCMP
jgi:hypothetical protein